MKNRKYWQKRFSDLENAQNQYGQRTFHQIEPAFDKAQRQIQAQIETWYQRYADNNGITMAEARKQLTAAELQELQWGVQDYIKYGQENAINQQWMKQLENASARYHISRLEALKLRSQNALEVAYGNELDSIDSMMKFLYQSGYYHTCFEVQKGFNIGWEIGQIDERKLQKVIGKPWASDGKTFSDRIWQAKTTMVNDLHQQLTRTIIQGKAPDEAINNMTKYLQDKTKNAKYNAGRLVMTEQAFISSAAQKDAFNDLDVEEFEIVATLDSHTSEICQEMDGKHFPMKDFEPGVTAPPFHVWCRSTTVPYFDDEWGRSGERAARGEDGKTYYVPADMTYPEWKEQYASSPVAVSQVKKISEKEDSNDYSVDRKLVNSKDFHDKFDGLTSHKMVNEAVYQEAMNILEHRDGTDLEDLVILDARTGTIIVKNTLSNTPNQTGLTDEQYNIYQQAGGEKILLHNHPSGGRLSFTDLKTLFANEDIEASIVIGHNGKVYIAKKPDRENDIEKIYESLYDNHKSEYGSSELARVHALDDLYKLKLFEYESR